MINLWRNLFIIKVINFAISENCVYLHIENSYNFADMNDFEAIVESAQLENFYFPVRKEHQACSPDAASNVPILSQLVAQSSKLKICSSI
jgi:hypothetical protein